MSHPIHSTNGSPPQGTQWSINQLDGVSIHQAIQQFSQRSAPLNRGDRPHPFYHSSPHPFQPWNWDIHIFNDVPSTQSILWQQIDHQHPPEGAVQPMVVLARQQTQGKGQWARQWISPPGGLYLSAELPITVPVQKKAMLTLSTAWGIASTLGQSGVSIGLKWPNDLVRDRKKLGGILLETRIRGDRISQAVIGVGLNWTNPVPEGGVTLHRLLTESLTTQTTISSPIHTLNDVAALVLLGIQTGVERWHQDGDGAIAAAYGQLLVNHGQRVSIPDPVYPHAPIQGEVVGIDRSGYLIVRIPAPSPHETTETLVAPGTLSLGYEAD